jgi:polar amino acid transport system substrate-binding protein
MTRHRWVFAICLLLVGVGLFAWLAWPGSDSPLARLLLGDLTWQQMERTQKWRVGMDPSFPPFEFLEDNGAPAGYDVDLARAIAAQWGMDAEIVAIGFDSLPDALRAAKIDSILSAYPYDDRLTRDFAFSTPYFDAGLLLAVLPGSPITRVDDLAGRRVAVEWGSLGDMVGRRLQRQGIAVDIVPYETPDEAVNAAATQADIAAVLIDAVSLHQAQGRGVALEAAGPIIESSPYVIVAPIRATDLHANLNAALDMLRQEGALAELEARWFAAGAVPANLKE